MGEDSISGDGYCAENVAFSAITTAALTLTDASATTVAFTDVGNVSEGDYEDQGCR